MSTYVDAASPKPVLPTEGTGNSRTQSLAPAAGVLAFLAFLCVNHLHATGGLDAMAIAFFGAFTLTCLVYGKLVRAAVGRWGEIDIGQPFDLLAGFLAANTLLFIVSLASPLGMRVNASLVFALGLLLAATLLRKAGRRPATVPDSAPAGAWAGIIAVAISAIGATLWSWQAQTVVYSDGQVVYQAWRDTFIHVREISAFAQAFGAGTLQDIKLAGSSAAIYHFASYLSPAAAEAFTHAPAVSLYASFQLPVGIFLAGMGAFCLAATFWGVWPAVAATVAVVVLPDAYQQGFANRYLSYNFLSQVNLGMLYGLACIALAWVFMITGCRRQKLGLVALGYVFLVICAFYKAHLFVANAFLILMYPTIFFRGVQLRWRLAIGALFIAVYLAAIWVTQSHPRIPLLRLDGSGLTWYVKNLITDFDPGMLKDFFAPKFVTGGSKPLRGVYAAMMITLCTFGVWLVLAPVAWLRARRGAPWATLLFPIAVVVNYWVMSLGLAMDEKRVGTPDELLNRPLVWAYFAIALWAAGGLYHAVWRNRPPAGRWGNVVSIGLLAVALVALGRFAGDLQVFPTRGFPTFSSFNAVPACVVRSAEYIRSHSPPGDLVQDSENDLRFGFTALAERQLFAGESSFGGLTDEHAKRLKDLSSFLQMREPEQIRAFATESGIRWYLLRPTTANAWPQAVLADPAFECGGYKVFRF